MLLSEIVYNIRNLIAGGILSDDENLSKLQVGFMVNYYRAKLLKQDQDKGRLNQTLYTQNLGLVDLIQADKNECCALGFTTECILRSKFKVPRPLETNQSLNFTFVGLLDGTPFTQVTHNSAYWSFAAKYTGKITKWYYLNGYIYLLNPSSIMLDAINIQGIFEDPLEANRFKSCDCPGNNIDCDNAFSSFEFDYPLPLHHTDTIVKLVAQSEVALLRAFPTDVSNNGIDNTKSNA